MACSGWSSASMCRSSGDELGRTVDFVTTGAVGCSVVSLNGRGRDRRGGGRLTHGASGHMVAVSLRGAEPGELLAGCRSLHSRKLGRGAVISTRSVQLGQPLVLGSGSRVQYTGIGALWIRTCRSPECRDLDTPDSRERTQVRPLSQRQLRIPVASRRLVDVCLERACHLHRLTSTFMTRAARHTLVSHTAPDTCA